MLSDHQLEIRLSLRKLSERSTNNQPLVQNIFSTSAWNIKNDKITMPTLKILTQHLILVFFFLPSIFNSKKTPSMLRGTLNKEMILLKTVFIILKNLTKHFLFNHKRQNLPSHCISTAKAPGWPLLLSPYSADRMYCPRVRISSDQM